MTQYKTTAVFQGMQVEAIYGFDLTRRYYLQLNLPDKLLEPLLYVDFFSGMGRIEMLQLIEVYQVQVAEEHRTEIIMDRPF